MLRTTQNITKTKTDNISYRRNFFSPAYLTLEWLLLQSFITQKWAFKPILFWSGVLMRLCVCMGGIMLAGIIFFCFYTTLKRYHRYPDVLLTELLKYYLAMTAQRLNVAKTCYFNILSTVAISIAMLETICLESSNYYYDLWLE